MGDSPPSGEEAEAQRLRTTMRWIWMALGLIVVAAFVAWLALSSDTLPRSPMQPVVAPAEKPTGG